MWKWLALILILIAAAAAAWGLRGRFKGSKPVRRAVLVISGDTGGWITPCGCTSNQSGGLLRRGTYLRDLAQNADVIYADAGGAPAGTSEYQRLKFQAILTGENAMHIAAHNIGGPEAQLGPAYLREIAERLHVPLLGANVRDAAGQPVAPPFRIATAGGRRIVFIGVLSPKFATPRMIVNDPKQAVVAALAQAAGQFDLSIVLAYLPDEELAQLAADLPEVDGVVGGPTGQAIAPKPTIGPLLAAATNKGKFLVQLDIPAAKSQKLSGKIVELTGAFADQDVQLANLNRYLADLGNRDLRASQTGFAPELPPGTPASYRIAGSASCTACHAVEAQVWAGTAHAHAFATLKPRGFEVDADCQQCHTTGYGLPGGFDSARRTPLRIDVGCENCHGPSAAHVSDPKVHTPFLAADQCTRCHDRENSPQFDYGTYWLRIKHGKSAAATQTSLSEKVEFGRVTRLARSSKRIMGVSPMATVLRRIEPTSAIIFFDTIGRDTGVPLVRAVLYSRSVKHGRDGRVTIVPIATVARKSVTPVGSGFGTRAIAPQALRLRVALKAACRSSIFPSMPEAFS